jgi:endoglucanase
VIGKSTTSTLDFAAMMAIASRSYQNFNAEYASDCRLRAERAWKWAIQHPSAFFINPPDIHTGTYADSHVDDEFIFAAAELYIATNDNEYKNFLLKRPEQLLYNHAPDWPHMQETGVLSLAVMSNNFPPDIKNKIQQSVIKHADTTRMQVNNSPYRIPKIEYHWGSNGRMANEGLCLVYAFKLTGDTSYIITANEIADYLLGKNATGFSFITGFGSKQPMYIHHRPSIADRIIQPIPGFVVGGPNNDKQDIRAGVVYTSTWPAKAYLDSEKSFASNEVCINWNAPAVALFAAIDNILGSKYLADWAQYYVLPK